MRQQLLIVDDSKPIHNLVKAVLANDPVDIHTANDAEFGLILAESVQPDLMLLDVDMPGMNGFEACRKLRTTRATASIPVIFLTSMQTLEDKLRGLQLQAVDYITKPFNWKELLARVRGALRTSKEIHSLKEKALIDPLTELGNRAMFENRLTGELALRVRSEDPLSCILLDVDNFKTINDRFGHSVGDQALRQVAGVISRLRRTEDVGCRHGGDEFSVIMPNTSAKDAAVLAERMRSGISKIHSKADKEFKITCSFGVTEALDPYDREMFQRADEALYRSKKAGKNRVSIAQSAMPAEPLEAQAA